MRFLYCSLSVPHFLIRSDNKYNYTYLSQCGLADDQETLLPLQDKLGFYGNYCEGQFVTNYPFAGLFGYQVLIPTVIFVFVVGG